MASSVLDTCIATLLEGIGGNSTTSANSLELERCTSDIVYFIDNYCMTYDPRTPAKSLAFKLYPKQVEFIRWLEQLERDQSNGLCEKSRGVGVSFLCGAYALHGWLFKPGWKCGFGSRKLEYVDKLGDLNSLFEKMRFMLRRLPQWMLPKGFKPSIHDCYTKLINPANGSAITGEGGDMIGRGGRNSIYIVDESAFLEHPMLVDGALTENTNVRIDVSTPNGPGNPFATKRFSGEVSVFTYRWTDDPRKNKEWAEKTKREKGPVVFASEYDIDYSASIEGITIPGAWVRAAVELELLGYGRFRQRETRSLASNADPWGDNSSNSLYANGSNEVVDDSSEVKDEREIKKRVICNGNGSVLDISSGTSNHNNNTDDEIGNERSSERHSTKSSGRDDYGRVRSTVANIDRSNNNKTLKGRWIAGLDIGEEGNDLSVFIPRNGPIVGEPISWGKLLTTQTAWKARDLGRELGVKEVHYDADGVGTGVKGTWNSSEIPLPFKAVPVHSGASPTESIWPDGQTSKEKFANLKAELWWRLRTRFERTYEYVTQGIKHPIEDLISIPNCPQLIADLSLPLYNTTETGKIKIESKESLKRRGVKSPDYADALVMSEAAYAVKKQQFWFR
jgi:hypothetical protein